jgi:hypothetical protein
MHHYELIPGKGIRFGEIEIFFNKQRTELRAELGFDKKENEGIFDDEDEYGIDGEDGILLRFLGNKLCDIEVHGGRLVYDDIELKHTDIRKLQDALHNSGIALSEESEWLTEGRDCIDLQIVVATAGDADQVEDDNYDRIAWVTTSVDFKVEDA